MKESSIEKTRQVLANDLEKYVQIILKEYGKYIPEERKKELESIDDFVSSIIITNRNTISMSANRDSINMPKLAYKVFKYIRFIPGHGINKKHKLYNDGEIENDKTYYDYMKHVVLSGMTVEEFFRDSLLHETMHFCGSRGSDALREGINELKTRELAEKYGLKASRCGYPKEVAIASRLQEIIGKKIMDEIAFSRNNNEAIEILRRKCGVGVVLLFKNVLQCMNEEYKSKYDHSKFGGLFGPIKKAKAYSQLDYSQVFELIEEYKKKQEEIDQSIAEIFGDEQIHTTIQRHLKERDNRRSSETNCRSNNGISHGGDRDV